MAASAVYPARPAVPAVLPRRCRNGPHEAQSYHNPPLGPLRLEFTNAVRVFRCGGVSHLVRKPQIANQRRRAPLRTFAEDAYSKGGGDQRSLEVSARRGKPLLTDALWNRIEPLLPSAEPKPEGGRPPISDRAALTSILFVPRTGCRWEYLPQELAAVLA